MKNLSRKDLQMEFEAINKKCVAIEQEIEESNIYGHELYLKRIRNYELIGAMKILQKLINQLN